MLVSPFTEERVNISFAVLADDITTKTISPSSTVEALRVRSNVSTKWLQKELQEEGFKLNPQKRDCLLTAAGKGAQAVARAFHSGQSGIGGTPQQVMKTLGAHLKHDQTCRFEIHKRIEGGRKAFFCLSPFWFKVPSFCLGKMSSKLQWIPSSCQASLSDSSP